jgi:hypothetical protein
MTNDYQCKEKGDGVAFMLAAAFFIAGLAFFSNGC